MTSLAKRSIVIAVITLFTSVSVFAFTTVDATTLQSDGTAPDTQAAINAAASGTTILLPAGTFTWTSGVTISGKPIKVQGAGAGGRLLRFGNHGWHGHESFHSQNRVGCEHRVTPFHDHERRNAEDLAPWRQSRQRSF